MAAPIEDTANSSGWARLYPGGLAGRISGSASKEQADLWPNTTRLLPWMLALFLVLLWLTPIDSTTLPVRLPIDSTLDRFAIGALVVAWLIALGVGGTFSPKWRPSKATAGVGIFLLVATASIILNLASVVRDEELSLALKQIALLASFGSLFVVVATGIRRQEVPRFTAFMLILASVMAVGTIIQYRTGANYFYQWMSKLPLLSVEPPPTNVNYGRPDILGPTKHGLAVSTMLGLMMPFAIVGLLRSKARGRRLLYAIALTLLIAGSIATLRKTAFVLPVVAVFTLVLYRPKQMLRLLPLGILILGCVKVAAPQALGGIRSQILDDPEHSTEARTRDYAAVEPDILSHPLIGRGYGTYSPKGYLETTHGERHRLLDNQALTLLIEIGIAGLAAYLCVGVLAIVAFHKTARSDNLTRAGPAIAAIAATVVFFVANDLFDTLAFRQAPYVFFFVLGIGVVATSRASEDSSPESAQEEVDRKPIRVGAIGEEEGLLT